MTSPLLPPDEVPLDERTIDALLSLLGDDMILVGGQALAFWMRRFGIRPDDATISNDGDALGTFEAAQRLAHALDAELIKPPARALTAVVAQLRLPRPQGRAANIDILHRLFATGGLRKSGEFTRRVIARSLRARLEDGTTFRIMDPFDVLASRIENAAGLLEDKGPHVLTQARWAVELARAALRRVASGEHDDSSAHRVGGILADIVRLARSSAGRNVWKEHRIDVLDAVDLEYLTLHLRTHAPQLEKIAEAQARRSTT